MGILALRRSRPRLYSFGFYYRQNIIGGMAVRGAPNNSIPAALLKRHKDFAVFLDAGRLEKNKTGEKRSRFFRSLAKPSVRVGKPFNGSFV